MRNHYENVDSLTDYSGENRQMRTRGGRSRWTANSSLNSTHQRISKNRILLPSTWFILYYRRDRLLAEGFGSPSTCLAYSLYLHWYICSIIWHLNGSFVELFRAPKLTSIWIEKYNVISIIFSICDSFSQRLISLHSTSDYLILKVKINWKNWSKLSNIFSIYLEIVVNV